ncbi:MAG: terpene cyclase/mutase family protein [Pirellulales bacterium]|nr:terpene cyclase/mutase family protein [Pirellulales bacterium]
MAEQEATKNTMPHPEPPLEAAGMGLFEKAKLWFSEEGPWWMCSFVFHLVLICSLALIAGKTVEKMVDQAPAFDEVELAKPDDVPLEQEEIEPFDVSQTPLEPTELTTDTLTLEKPAQLAQEEKYYDDSPIFSERGGGTPSGSEGDFGGLGGFDIKGVGAGPAVRGKGGVGSGLGTGTHPGRGGSGWGFGGRGTGSRKKMLASGGGTRQSERAVAAALNWLARHQSPNGGWNLKTYTARCKDDTCTGVGTAGDRPAAATAMGLLPFLAAGQTHQSKGPYKNTIAKGIYYLIQNQKSDGDLRMGGAMYDHGLAAIALCECYGMSNDNKLRPHAQAALNFIANAQDPEGGGWRYQPKQPGDTSVVGWQVMALKSGQMAYLTVNPAVLEGAKKFLESVSTGDQGSNRKGGLFGYTTPGRGLATTAVGLLCYQYMDVPKEDPAMVEGTAFLMKNLPKKNSGRNIYYWYYATQVLHNQPGPDWDAWNREMRRLLIDTQCNEGCAAGSWDPEKPNADQYGRSGGRIMTTSLSALTLEVYYRYLPLYKLDGGREVK